MKLAKLLPSGAFIEFKIDNKFIHSQKANSFVKQFHQILAVQVIGATVSVRDINNTLRNVEPNASNLKMIGGAGATSYGIVVGSGTNAVSWDDYKLQAQITNITHYAVNYAVESNRLVLIRNFYNGTENNVTINEVGLYGIGYSPTANYYFCFERTVLQQSIVLEAGKTLTVTYYITY